MPWNRMKKKAMFTRRSVRSEYARIRYETVADQRDNDLYPSVNDGKQQQHAYFSVAFSSIRWLFTNDSFKLKCVHYCICLLCARSLAFFPVLVAASPVECNCTEPINNNTQWNLLVRRITFHLVCVLSDVSAERVAISHCIALLRLQIIYSTDYDYRWPSCAAGDVAHTNITNSQRENSSLAIRINR